MLSNPHPRTSPQVASEGLSFITETVRTSTIKLMTEIGQKCCIISDLFDKNLMEDCFQNNLRKRGRDSTASVVQ